MVKNKNQDKVFVGVREGDSGVILDTLTAKAGGRDVTMVKINHYVADRAMKKAVVAHLRRQRDQDEEC